MSDKNIFGDMKETSRESKGYGKIYRLEDRLEEGIISRLKNIGKNMCYSLPFTIPAVLGITTGIVDYYLHSDRTALHPEILNIVEKLNPYISFTDHPPFSDSPLVNGICTGLGALVFSFGITGSLAFIMWGFYENIKIDRILSKYDKDLDKNVKRRRKYEEDEINTQS